MDRSLTNIGEGLVFAPDATITFVDDVCELTLKSERCRVSAAAYRTVVRGAADASTEAREVCATLKRAGILVSPGLAAEAGRPPPMGALLAQIGSFRPHRALGHGSFGSVFEAYDVERGIDCAVKICDQLDPESLLDFKSEARTAWSLSHPHLIVPFRLGCERGLWFYAMELVRGRRITDAFAALAPEERLSWLARVVPELVDALEALHRRGVLHLDLTPNNIMVRDDGSAALLDFGLARWRGERPLGTRGVTAQPLGTLAYMAPELLLGREPGPACDWYSLGALLHRLLAGALPFAELGDMALTLRPVADPPPTLRKLDWVPPQLARAVESLLQPRPERRKDGRALLAALVAGTLPAQSGSVQAPIFLGRDDLLHRLAELRQLASASPALVQLVGPPGIGKTAVVARFRAVGGGLVLAGRCYEHEHLPYKGMEGAIDELRQWLHARAPAELLARLRPHLAGAARLFPGLSEFVADAPAGAPEATTTERGLAYQQLKSALREVAEHVPLTLVLDDVHWSDRDTAQLLVELLSPPHPPNALVLCTQRADEAAASSPFVAEVERLAARGLLFHRAVLEVGPLDAASMRALVEHHAAAVEPRLVERALDEAAGSPFLAEEFARWLAERPVSPSQVPALRDVVAARVAALNADERDGRSLDEGVLAAASRAERTQVSRALISLKTRSLLRGAVHEGRPTVAVYHDRLRGETVALLAPADRAAHHRRWIEVLEPRAVAPHELFVHYRAVDDRPRAVALAVEAAGQAAAALAFERAAEWYREALELDPGDARPLLLARRADALFNAGRSAAAAEAFVAAAHDAREAPRVRPRRAADAYLLAGRFTEGRELLLPILRERDIAVTRGTVSLLGSIIGQMVSLRLRGTAPQPPPVTQDDDELAVVDACWSLGRALAFVEPLTGVDFVLRSLRRALRTGDLHRIARALAFLSAGVFFQIPVLRGAAREHLAQASRIAAALDDRGLQAVTAMWEAMIEIGTGNWRSALDRLTEALSVLDRNCVGLHWERVIAGGLAVWLLMHLGEIRRGIDLAARMLGDAGERGDLYGQVQFIQYTAWDQILRGRTAEARQQARWIAATWSVGTYTVQSFYTMLLEALCDLYDDDDAAARARWQDGQPAFRRAGGLRAPQSRIDNAILEARILLRQAPVGATDRRRLGRIARDFAAEERSDGRAHAHWIGAALHVGEGRHTEAGQRLHAAVRVYTHDGLGHWAAAAAAQASRFDHAHAGCDDAVAHFAAAGIADWPRWVDTFMPLGPDAPSWPAS